MYNIPGYDKRYFIVNIDSYKDGVPEGRFFNPCTEDKGEFKSLVQLLVKLEQSMDAEKIPQSYNSSRSFIPLMYYSDEALSNTEQKDGKVGNFAVKILFRKNSSWQGKITWLEKNQNVSFRSVFEMIMLMNSALSGSAMVNREEQETFGKVAEG